MQGIIITLLAPYSPYFPIYIIYEWRIVSPAYFRVYRPIHLNEIEIEFTLHISVTLSHPGCSTPRVGEWWFVLFFVFLLFPVFLFWLFL